MRLNGRKIFEGKAEGAVLKSNSPISFYGGVDPNTGIVVEKGHELEGKSVKGKILVFTTGKGSTVGSYTLYRLKKNNSAPLAIVNKECETIVAVGAIISKIPAIDKIDIEKINSGQRVIVDSEKGFVEVIE